MHCSSKGYRLGFSVRGKDYVYPGGQGTDFGEYGEWTGCGLFKHDDPKIDRKHIRRSGDIAYWPRQTGFCDASNYTGKVKSL